MFRFLINVKDLNEKQLGNEELLKDLKNSLYEMLEVGSQDYYVVSCCLNNALVERYS